MQECFVNSTRDVTSVMGLIEMSVALANDMQRSVDGGTAASVAGAVSTRQA